MKKLVFTLLICCLGCEKEDNELVVDDNLIGIWESIEPVQVDESINTYSIVYTPCFIDSNHVGYVMFGPFSFEFNYPNNYVITTSNTHHFNDNNVVSVGTFHNDGSQVFFNGNFKQSFWDYQGSLITTIQVENINFHCDYSLSDTLLTISEITTSSPFEVNTELTVPGWGLDCPILINNSSLESYINNHPMLLDDRVYNKLN